MCAPFRGFVRLMDHPTETRPVNLGHAVEITMIELIGEVLGKSVDLVTKPLPVDNPRQTRPDIMRTRAAPGFQRKVALWERLERTVAYFAAAAATAVT